MARCDALAPAHRSDVRASVRANARANRKYRNKQEKLSTGLKQVWTIAVP